jgi:hypothetical protein
MGPYRRFAGAVKGELEVGPRWGLLLVDCGRFEQVFS